MRALTNGISSPAHALVTRYRAYFVVNPLILASLCFAADHVILHRTRQRRHRQALRRAGNSVGASGTADICRRFIVSFRPRLWLPAVNSEEVGLRYTVPEGPL